MAQFFFECPLNSKPRTRFYSSDTNISTIINHRHGFPTLQPLSHFIELIVQSHDNQRLVDALAYLSLDVFYIRRSFFKKIAVERANVQATR